MTKRKSKRSYGSPPEAHQRLANEKFSDVLDATERATEMIEAGRCGRALTAIGSAHENSGALRAHLRAAFGTNPDGTIPETPETERVFEMAESVERKIDLVEHSFNQRCVKEAVVDRSTGRVHLGLNKK